MDKMNWSEVSAQMAALAEEIGAEPEVEETELEEEVQPLSEAQLSALAEMLGVDVSELVDAKEEIVEEMMEYLGYKLLSHSYGRAGLSGKLPWEKNGESAGKATQGQSSASTSPPGDSTAKVPIQARMNKFMQTGKGG